MRVVGVEWRDEKLQRLRTQRELIAQIEEYIRASVEKGGQIVVFPAMTGVLFQYLVGRGRSLEDVIRQIRCGVGGASCRGCEVDGAECDGNGGVGEVDSEERNLAEGLLVEGVSNFDYVDYLKEITEISRRYKVVICPGSYWESDGSEVYHTTALVADGEIITQQRQIYLARWERELGIARGVEQKVVEIDGWRVGLVLGSDVFYPQVSRSLAMIGVNLVIAPVAFVGEQNRWMQVSGMWKDVQQNQFFAVESGFNGVLGDTKFWGETIIHAPVEMTSREDGFLRRTRSVWQHGEPEKENTAEMDVQGSLGPMVFAELEEKRRKWAVAQFDVLRQLNCNLYYKMGLFGG